jgi:hypothetical protein
MGYNYYISNKGLVEESDKEENLEVIGAAAASCLKRSLAPSLPGRHPSHKYLADPSHRSRFMYKCFTRSTFCSNGNSYTVSTHSDICI